RFGPGVAGLLPHFDTFRTTDGNGLGSFLTRLRITPSGRVKREDLCNLTSEFPQHDWRRTTREHRYSYLATAREGHWLSSLNAITKIDHRSGEIRQHELPNGHTVGEPIFVPRTEDAAEDDGCLLAVADAPAA